MHVTATFDSRPAAEAALAQLEYEGIRTTQVVLETEDTGEKPVVAESPVVKIERTAGSAVFGGLIGSIVGGVMAGVTIAMPGVHLSATEGFAEALAICGAGALVGGALGAFISAGLFGAERHLGAEEADLLVDIQPDNDAQKDRIEAILRDSGARLAS
jgi:hypothetical protein